MKKLMLGLFLMGLTTQIFAQDPTQLPEVVIVHNYKYLNSVNSEDVAIPVEKLQLKVSDFNVKNLDIYSDEYDLYDVYFIIPEGKILASYNNEGDLLSTAERYKDINLPSPVLKSIVNRFPNWSISKNVYLVNYHDTGNIRKLYKITLENGKQRIRVKVDDQGNFQ
ncbi:nicotinate-nucleotide adenylyltransferase [Changchengzhania lutea]|uniref:nicotinate-nucleotide adenylyltransferase n=1 Tax=Changchengzhania lutea TaxID=2049305 RepID=UPI00115EA87D|nr:nicotinate-nucleotide adenylyltransferase [Changchengzhania lutea]